MSAGRPLAGRVHIVTGASGMAADAARRFADLGADVVVIAQDRAQCEALALPYEAADLTDEAAAVAAFAAARKRHGRIDAVYAVAGGSGRRLGDGPLDRVALAAWTATVDLNLTPAFLALRESVRIMLGQEPGPDGTRGAVAVMTSVLAVDPAPSLFATHAYAAAKAAAIGLVRAAAAAYAPQRIRINAIAPSLVTTPMSARAAADPDTVTFSRVKQPLTGGFLDPADVTATAVHLLGPGGRAITGQVVVVDGGWTVSGEHR